MPQSNNTPTLTDKEYVEELEKIVIFLCDVYSKGQDSLTCQTDEHGNVDDKWLGVYMSFPTIQGWSNRNAVENIGKLRTKLGNREAVKLSFADLYERLKVGRKADR
jgi:hypothetical protein